MRKVFQFHDPESFRSEASTEFAELVYRASSGIRSRLSKSFGLSLQLDSDPIRITHNGRKIGIGSFSSTYGEVHFSIAPKTDSVALKSLLQALGKTRQVERYIHLNDDDSIGPVQGREGDFTPAFLVALLKEIVTCSDFLLNVSHTKTKQSIKGGIKGRPLLQESFRNIYLGRQTEFVCEVPNHAELQEYALVLLETARSISRLLDEWHEIIGDKSAEYLNKLKLVSARFGIWNSSGFSRTLLYRICRPPFPFGLRDVLYKCMRYWQWHDGIRLDQEGKGLLGYWQMTADLDQLFQMYVGEVWNASIGNEYKWIPSPVCMYGIDNFDNTSSNRRFILDHLFVQRNGSIVLIVDAKYRLDIGSPDQVYQMCSYLGYEYPEFKTAESKIGILAYPGLNWKVGKLAGFDKAIYCIQIPITSELKRTEIAPFLSEVLS